MYSIDLLLPFVIGDFTTNLAKSYMNVCSKFDGGKQINRSQRGSWQGRCAGAGLRLNIGPDWGPTTWESVTKTAPSLQVQHLMWLDLPNVLRWLRTGKRKQKKQLRHGTKETSQTIKAR